MSLHLPSDLVHCVVDHLADDQEALLNCSLVSWDFLHPARKHIFSHIPLKASPNDELPATLLYDFLSNAQHLIAYVTSLRLVVETSGLPPASDNQTGWIFEDNAALTLVLPMLHNLMQISMESTTNPLKWTLLPSHLQDALYEVFTRPKLSKLSLIQIQDFPITTLRKCSNLKDLALRCVSFLVEEPDVSYREFSTPLRLDNLEMIESRDIFFKLNAWLQNPHSAGLDITSLKRLSLAIYGRSIRYNEDMTAISRFLEQSSPTLEVLKLTPPVMCADISDITNNPLQLTTIPNLHKLEFSFEISDFDDVETSPSFLWLSKVFTNLPQSNIIEDVVLNCEILQANPLGEFDNRIWKEMDGFLTCKELTRLRRVSLIVHPIYSAGKTHTPLDTALLEKEMSILSQRNLLQVEKH